MNVHEIDCRRYPVYDTVQSIAIARVSHSDGLLNYWSTRVLIDRYSFALIPKI